MYKKGDKLLCKKDYHSSFTKGKVYTIEFSMASLGVDVISNSREEIGFYFHKTIDKEPFYFYEYFYTDQELRKEKLNKILQYEEENT